MQLILITGQLGDPPLVYSITVLLLPLILHSISLGDIVLLHKIVRRHADYSFPPLKWFSPSRLNSFICMFFQPPYFFLSNSVHALSSHPNTWNSWLFISYWEKICIEGTLNLSKYCPKLVQFMDSSLCFKVVIHGRRLVHLFSYFIMFTIPKYDS